jgi:hypothetical protein
MSAQALPFRAISIPNGFTTASITRRLKDIRANPMFDIT